MNGAHSRRSPVDESADLQKRERRRVTKKRILRRKREKEKRQKEGERGGGKGKKEKTEKGAMEG